MGHNLVMIVVWNLFFISLYGINIDVIHLLVLFEHWCHVHGLNTNVICLFVLFRHEFCVSIHIVYTRKLCTQFLCLNNAQHSCLNNTNLWNNRFCTNLKWTYETYKFVMILSNYVFSKSERTKTNFGCFLQPIPSLLYLKSYCPWYNIPSQNLFG